MENIFTNWIFTDYILPWILVFVLMFSVLDKTKLLGEGKKQINAIIGAVCGLILLSFESSRDLIVQLIPILVVMIVVVFIFMLVFGFISGETKGDVLKNKWVKMILGISVAIIILVFVIILSGKWDYFFGQASGMAGTTIIFVLIAIGAIVAVLAGDKKKE